MKLCHLAGLMRWLNNKDGIGYVVDVNAWNSLIDEYYLSDIMERLNNTQVGGKDHYFINIGNTNHPKVIFHLLAYQFNGKVSKPTIRIHSQ